MAVDVVAQGLRHQSVKFQASTSRTVRKVIANPLTESDSDSSGSDDA